MADINQELLIAALALLTSAVPREAVHSALLKRSENPEQDLAQLLKEGGWLDKGQVEALKCLVESHLRNHNGDLRASIDAWNAEALTQDLLTEVEQTAPGSTLGTALDPHLGSTIGASDQGERRGTPPRETPNFTQDQRFVRIRLHAQGGIGDVYLARDRELQRNVALKEIQQKYVDRRDQQDRFLLEAEITGNLEHPGIVPVYSLGRNAAGRPFYAMRFIEGESFSAAIKRFHDERKQAATAAKGQTGSLWGVEFQQLLRRFLDVCDAIEYAHSRNVIHRDLKPGNIMLGQYGETLVVDWGLAKIVGKNDIVAEHVESGIGDDFDLTQVAGGITATAGGETQPGTTIGTPAYMSPEQAHGAIEELGPASDVYSLGATLYELLTGSVPYPGKHAGETVRLVREGKLKPPRALQPSLPAPLEAICVQAMASNPADRYQSARELAVDLEHWMADEPVIAYPERAPQKVGRWLRRHRTLTYGLGMTLGGIALVATIALFVLNDARRRESDARAEAESNFQMALKAVDTYLTNVSENRLLKEQDTLDIRTLRQELLESALPFYKEFVEKRAQDPKLREQLANAYFRLGDITRVIGTSQDALEYYRSAHALWGPLASSHPENLEFQSRLADCDLALAQLVKSKDLPRALESLNQALASYEQMVLLKPDEPRYQSSLAECYSELGLCLSYRNEVESSLGRLHKCREILQELVKSYPDHIDYKKDLAQCVNRIGFVDFTRRDYPAALKHYEEFQNQCQEILDDVKEGPKPQKILDMLAQSYFNIAVMQSERADAERSLEASEKAAECWSNLVKLAPSVTGYKRDLGRTYFSRAWTQHQMGKDAEAMASADAALKIYDRLIKEEPENLVDQCNRCDVMNFQATVYYEARKNDQALRIYQEVLDLRRSILQRSSGIDDRKVDLCMSLGNLGEAQIYQGEVDRGLALRREEIALRQELYGAHPEDRGYAMDLADAWAASGDTLRLGGDSRAAGDAYDHARAVLEPLLAAHPDDGELQGKLGHVLERKANVLADTGQDQAAIEFLRQAAEYARKSLQAQAVLARPAEALSEAIWKLARLLRVHGEPREASRLDQERISLWKKRPVADLVALAKLQAARAEEIDHRKSRTTKIDLKVQAEDRDQAADGIKLGLKLGLKEPAQLRAHPDLAPLLEREDVKPLLDPSPLPDGRSGR